MTSTEWLPEVRKKRKEETCIHDLPEEIMLSIVLKLGLKDVLRASMTSRAWERLPLFLTSIEFGWVNLGNNDLGLCDCQHSTQKFIKKVNQFMERCNKLQDGITPVSPLGSLHIGFCLNREYADDIDNWMRFAVKKGVKSLILLCQCNRNHRSWTGIVKQEQAYIFPCDLLNDLAASLEHLFLSDCILGRNMIAKCTSLVKLELFDVALTECDVDEFLRCCPNLVDVTLYSCSLPPVLTIPGGPLKYLNVELCPNLKEVVLLDGKSLIQFAFGGHGKHLKIRFQNVSQLIVISFRMTAPEECEYVFQQIHQEFPAMRYLSIVRMEKLPPLRRSYGQITTFRRLILLRLYCHWSHSFSIWEVLDIVTACEVIDTIEMLPPYEMDAEDYGNHRIKPFHKSLKYVRVKGFCGNKGHFELARLLIDVPLGGLKEMLLARSGMVWCGQPQDDYREWEGEEEPNIVKEALSKEMKSGTLIFL